jgi:hypothetical protein
LCERRECSEDDAPLLQMSISREEIDLLMKDSARICIISIEHLLSSILLLFTFSAENDQNKEKETEVR